MLPSYHPSDACTHAAQVRLLFSERFKELHAEAPPLDVHMPPLAGAVRSHPEYDDDFYDDDYEEEEEDFDDMMGGGYDDFDEDGEDWGDDEGLDDDGEMFW